MNHRKTFIALLMVPLVSSCSIITGTLGAEIDHAMGGIEEVRDDLDRPASVNAVAWSWEAPEGVADLDGLFPVPGGVAALVDDGVVGLSGETAV